jgi:hypothetical protein
MKKRLHFIILFIFFFVNTQAQDSDPDQGLRANWLRGTWGINWKPVDLYNGGHEGLSIEPLLEQISHLKTIDYLQIHLGESSIKSSVHMGSNSLLESFWEGDTDDDGNPMNLVVPRVSYGEDPFWEIINAIREAGMKVMVYVNSSNMLSREGDGGSNPDYIPNITERWKAWCDSTPEVQAFIASQAYHTGIWDAATETYVDAEDEYPERKYMFCYAEFVLKVYAIRYGDLIDGWCFDSGTWMVKEGDSATNGVYEDQMIFNAFAAACRAGNPNVACAFQNSPERDTEELNPFSEATHADDFMFGHPYNGGNDIGSHTIGDPSLYERNYAHIEKMIETNGNVHSGIDPQTWTWDDSVVGHFDPPMSTSSWNGGNTAALTDDEFNLWNLEAVQNGGAISWGLPLVSKSGTNEQLIANDWSLEQLNGMDAHLMEFESPGAPNWARSETYLPTAYIGQIFTRDLVEGTDFWDPEGDEITAVIIASPDSIPSWLSINKTTTGTWTLSGVPNETAYTKYIFRLQVKDASGGSDRLVTLNVYDPYNIPVSEILASPGWASMSIGETQSLAALIYPSDASDKSYSWSSSDTTTATVNSNGLVTALATGSVAITATTNDGSYTDECTVVVVDAITVSGVEVSPNSVSLTVLGETVVLSASVLPTDATDQSISWNSNDISVATVNPSGEVTANGAGSAIITATTTDGGLSDSCQISVILESEEEPYAGGLEVEIMAAEDSIYGVNNIAVMVSETITAPDGIATFQISIDVTPESGKSIASGISGGISTTKSWGLTGDGRETTKNYLFFGDSLDWVDIGNAQVINFNANGGDLSLSDFGDVVFDAITVINGQSSNKDAVAYEINGTVTDLGNVGESSSIIDLPEVNEFSIGNGLSPNQLNNKWCIDGVTVMYSIQSYYSLNVSSEGGSVLISPEQTTFMSGTEVMLIAKPDSAYSFTDWNGDIEDAEINGDTLIVMMDADMNITANFSATTGVSQIADVIDFTISPNPSNGIFTVDMIQVNKGSYSVYSINGAKLMEGAFIGSFEFDLSNYGKGVYLFKMNSSQGVDVKRIIVN